MKEHVMVGMNEGLETPLCQNEDNNIFIVKAECIEPDEEEQIFPVKNEEIDFPLFENNEGRVIVKTEPIEPDTTTTQFSRNIDSMSGGKMETYEKDHKPAPETSRKKYLTRPDSEMYRVIDSIKKPFLCDICGKRTSRKGYMRKHMVSHLGEKPFACETCSKTYKIKAHLKEHQLTHSNLRPYSCETCGKAFARRYCLKMHQITHSRLDEKPYACETCAKTFMTKGYLRAHQLTHSRLRPYACETCGKAFRCQQILKGHQSIHFGVKDYDCGTCGKTFLRSHHLKAHQLSHTGIKPYACEICGKTFTRSYGLKAHALIHSGEKPSHRTLKKMVRSNDHSGARAYVCETCGTTFREKGHLSNHELTHSEVKPHVCESLPVATKTFKELKEQPPGHSGPELLQKVNNKRKLVPFGDRLLNHHQAADTFPEDITNGCFGYNDSLRAEKEEHIYTVKNEEFDD